MGGIAAGMDAATCCYANARRHATLPRGGRSAGPADVSGDSASGQIAARSAKRYAGST
jgi:hypothetical protein